MAVLCKSQLVSLSNPIDHRIVPGSFPNPVVSVGVCYTAVGRCRRRLDHGMVGYCVGVLLFTSFEPRAQLAAMRQPPSIFARLLCKVRPSPEPPFVCYTPYHIGNRNILWGSLVTCVEYCLRVHSVRALFLCKSQLAWPSNPVRS